MEPSARVPTPATVDDVERYGKHLERIIGLSGVGSHPVFTVRLAETFAFEPTRVASTKEALLKRLDEPGWQRIWLLTHGDRVVGNVTLNGGFTESLLHRATLGTAVEPDFQGQGVGRRMNEHAIQWAQGEPSLEWLDLQVFASNARAYHLYSKLGFEEYGRMEDACRIKGQAYTDVLMARRLHR